MQHSRLPTGAPDPLDPTRGPNGADLLRGGPGLDHADYATRTDPLVLSLDGLRNDGAPGERDLLDIDVERVTGGDAGDTITGSAAAEWLEGGRGADTLSGRGGNDRLLGGPIDEAADTLDGGSGADALDGGPGDDRVNGGADADALTGGSGADRLDGAGGADTADGGTGDDSLAGGSSGDRLLGGEGTDRADYSAAPVPVRITLDDRADDGAAGNDFVAPDVERLLGGSAADTLLGSADPNVIEGGAGADLIDGGGGEDTLLGQAGDDVLRARGDGPDDVGCGAGIDLAVLDAVDVQLPDPAERCERADVPGGDDGVAVLMAGGCAPLVGMPGLPQRLALTDELALPRKSTVDASSCPVVLTTGAGGRRARRARCGPDRRRVAPARSGWPSRGRSAVAAAHAHSRFGRPEPCA